jgi:hypothetical protein
MTIVTQRYDVTVVPTVTQVLEDGGIWTFGIGVAKPGPDFTLLTVVEADIKAEYDLGGTSYVERGMYFPSDQSGAGPGYVTVLFRFFALDAMDDPSIVGGSFFTAAFFRND